MRWPFNKSAIRVQYQLLHEHNGGQIPEHHAWFILGQVEYDGQPMVSWVALECENPGCNGRARLQLDDLLATPLGVVLPDPPGTRERYEQMKGKADV